MLLVKRFGVSLHEDIQRNLGASGMAWSIRPFSGSDACSNGFAAIGYDLDDLPPSRERPDAYTPEYLATNYMPPPGIGIMPLVVEIDSGSEDTRQLAQRARNWRACWEQYALLPAFFTTVETLSLGAGNRLHPWNPRRHLPDGRSVWVWHDMCGRPRSLRPWDLEEATLRFEQPEVVRMRGLRENIEGGRSMS